MKGRVDLSLRLSQVDPEAAKKLRMKKERKKKKETKLTSDGESVELNERFMTSLLYLLLVVHCCMVTYRRAGSCLETRL